MVDRQVQGISAWAVVRVSITMGICTRGYVVSPIPNVIITGIDDKVLVSTMVDSEI